MLMIRRDGKPIFLGSSKSYSLTLQRKKAAKLKWTQAWRRLHKKGITETTTKKRTSSYQQGATCRGGCVS